jgi:thiol-disulfide isomerase/thioredoxin
MAEMPQWNALTAYILKAILKFCVKTTKSKMEKKKKTIIWIIVIVILIALLILMLSLNSNNTSIYTIKDKSVISQDKCSQLEEYVIIYQTGCPHCERVIPRVQQVEQDLNVTFVHYNLAIKADFDKLNGIGLLPEGVPAVIIDCKAYLGDGYSVEDFENFVLASK